MAALPDLEIRVQRQHVSEDAILVEWSRLGPQARAFRITQLRNR
jgi:hypothetical protein